ncbi:MAG: S9 family peptidase [Candidatus Eisenbacteria bacterium]|nr:S9 family peptidase [Candidatus Eisenbacteria bacterium]
MKGRKIALFLATPLLLLPLRGEAVDYPETRRTDLVEEIHGTKVADPYRWMEDLDSEEIHRWVGEQNGLTFGFLEGIPGRKRITDRMTELWNYERFGMPTRRGNRYFFSKNDGLQNQSVYYVREALRGEPRVLIDPNGFSEDGTVALSQISISPRGRYVMYGTSESGSDWMTFHVRDVAGGKDMPDILKWIKFSDAAWTADEKGFYYARFAPPKEGDAYEDVNKNQKLYYHRLGDPQTRDRLVYERPDDPEIGFDPYVTPDGRFLLINLSRGSDRRNDVHLLDLRRPNRGMIRLFDRFDGVYDYVGNRGDVFYFRTNKDAPNYRLIAVDLNRPEQKEWTTLIPESDAVIDGIGMAHGHFVVSAMVDVKARLTLHDGKGNLVRRIDLPDIGAVNGVRCRPDWDEFFYDFESFNVPRTIYRYDFTRGESEVFFAPGIDYDVSSFVTEQVFYKSKDGTRVPMFLVHKKGIPMDGSNPTFVYAYGGFNISMTPYFRAYWLVWLEMGGMLAVPNLRGGGEYGNRWHEAGILDKKQNGIDDFISAVEYLIEKGYTSTPKVAIGGGSNGGMMVAAVANQRPDLLGAVIADVGVMDMLRFHKFTIGWAWTSDYGSPDDPEQFRTLRAYSPYHNIRPGVRYPAVLVLTSDHDDRVVPSHSFKYAAALQAAQEGDAPILIRIEEKAGHGAGLPTDKQIQERADKWAFLEEVLGMDVMP